VVEYRQLLTQQMQRHRQKAGRDELVSEHLDDFGRAVARESHQVAELQLEKNERLKRAFGIRADYVSGSAMSTTKKPANASASGVVTGANGTQVAKWGFWSCLWLKFRKKKKHLCM